MTDRQRLRCVRALHTMIYCIMSGAICTVAYAAVSGAAGVWLAVALTLTGAEVLVFARFGMKCPLSAVASAYGAKPGEDTFFPEAMTRHTLRVFGPLLGIGIALLLARWCGVLGVQP